MLVGSDEIVFFHNITIRCSLTVIGEGTIFVILGSIYYTLAGFCYFFYCISWESPTAFLISTKLSPVTLVVWGNTIVTCTERCRCEHQK